MATIKSYTDFSQSKVLAEILPLKSADYTRLGKNEDNVLARSYSESCNSELSAWMQKENLSPCWSLATLLNVLPKGIVINKDPQSGRYHFLSTHIGTYVTADNPIDAAYEIVIELHEENLL